MGSSQSCPVYDGAVAPADNFFRAEPVGRPAVDCSACAAASASRATWSHYWLVFHLLLSFVLVAYVRWSRVVVHNHACNQHDMPECCRLHQQQHQKHSAQVHAVSEDQVDSAVKQSDVSPPTATATGTAASPVGKPVPSAEEHKQTERLQALRVEYAAYLQMLKVRLPRVAVDHKLRAEGKDPAVLDELLETAETATKKPPPPPITIPETETPEAAEHRQKVESFQRMLKVGVPRPVVEIKARSEGVDPAELDSDEATATAATTVNSTGAVEPGDAGPPAWSRRSSVCSTVSTAPSTPDALATRTASAPGGGSFAALALRKMNTTMRKKLHWTTTPYTGAASSALRRDSLWSRIHTKAQHERVSISTESRRWMEKLFVKVASKTKAGRRRARSSSTNSNSSTTRRVSNLLPASLTASLSEAHDSEVRSSASYDDEDETEPEPEEEEEAEPPGAAFLRRKVYKMLLDHKKSQNIAIVLARVKRSFPELTREILTLDCPVLSSPALQALIDMWPDSVEQEAIDQFSGDVSTLATAEQFLLVARKVPRVQQKLRCLQFKMDFGARVEELRENLQLMTRGVRQVCASEGFGSVLEYIFHLGNLLNFGEDVEYTECVKSISISSLAKLSFTKAYDGRISFLQYVVQSIERDQPQLAHFGEQLSLVAKCSKMSVQSLHAERQALEAGHRMLVNETQKAAVFQTDDDELREQLAESRDAMRTYADEVDQELSSVRKLADELDRSKSAFLNYFEEEDALPLDELLGYIASFTGEYAREREQLILRARREQEQQRRKSLSMHRRSASVSNVTKRYSL